MRLTSLYKCCIDALQEIKRLDGRVSILLVRLELWGIGLFSNDILTLDNILDNREDRIREYLSKTFVHIAIAEGMGIFVALINDNSVGFSQNLPL